VTATTPDLMACVISRLLKDRETVFFGLASPLVMVGTLLAKATHAPNLTFLSIPGSVDAVLEELPRSTVDSVLLRGTQALFTLADVFDLSARGRLGTAFLSGVQIDRQGRINMSAIGPHERPKVRLPGGAGSALLMPTANRTILWRTRHDARTFVEKLDFVTAAGNSQWVVTPLCLFGRQPEGDLDVASIHPGITPDQLRAATGFPITVGPETPVTPLPSAEELAVLERLDPDGVRSAEF
jgi:glutaconate CoA-transferase subunit B